LENSFRAKCHHCHHIVNQPLHLSGQIAALFTRDGSGEPFHVLKCERGAGKSKSWSKKLLEDVGRGEGCIKTLADYSQVQGKARKIFLYKNCSKESNLNLLFYNLSSQMKGRAGKILRQFGLNRIHSVGGRGLNSQLHIYQNHLRHCASAVFLYWGYLTLAN
jgi:hypothetical protein